MRLTVINRVVNKLLVEQMKKEFKTKLEQAPIILQQIAEKNKKGFFNKLTDLNEWYTKVIGLHEVKLCQDKVTELQEVLLATQNQRRDFGKQLAEVRKKSNELQDQLHKVKRNENLDLFLTLMKEETEMIKLEHEILTTFQQYDQKEREVFTAFANAIRNSHEKQRAQLEYTKYFGVVLSIVGSFLAFCYSTLKKHDLKYFIESNVSALVNNSNELKLYLESIQNENTALVNNYNELKLYLDRVQNENSDFKLANSLSSNQIDNSTPVNVIENRDAHTQTFISEINKEENKVVKYALICILGLLILRVIAN